MGFKA